MKKYVLAVMVGLLAVSVTLFIVTSTPAEEKWPSVITFGSFVKGSASYPTNVALAKLATKYTPATAVVREYAGGAPGMEALIRGDIDTWGVGQNDFYNAYLGTGFWKGKPQDIRLLIGIWYFGPTGFGVRPRDNIRSLKDLAGKRCMVRSFLPYQNKLIETVMTHAGVWDKATIVKMGSTADLAPAMIEKKVDCFYWAIGGAYSLQIKQAVGIDWISLTEEEQRVGLAVTPGEVAWTAPRWILEMYDYPSDKVLRSHAYCFGIGVRGDMPDHVAYGILKAVYGENHLDEVRVLSQDLTDTNIELAVQGFWLPFHPGAVKFYEEQGVWTAAMEARQKEWLAKRGFSK